MSASSAPLTEEQLRQIAEDDAQELLGVGAEEAFAMIDRQDPRIRVTIAEIELNNIRWLLDRLNTLEVETEKDALSQSRRGTSKGSSTP